MTNLIGGPANGVTLMLRRSPAYLRVVVNTYGIKKEWDALDQLYDVAKPEETIYVYRLFERSGTVHLRMSKGRSGFYEMATYKFYEPQPDDKVIRNNETWRKWAQATFDAELKESSDEF